MGAERFPALKDCELAVKVKKDYVEDIPVR
jgi:hypothetical protein